MPLEKPPLDEAQIALVQRWIDEGAEWPAPAGTASTTSVASGHVEHTLDNTLLDVTNIKPGDVITGSVKLTNTGTLHSAAGSLTVNATNLVNSGLMELGAGGTVINALLKNTQSSDLPAVAANAALVQNFTVTGAVVGGAAGYFCRDLNVPGCENR